ncbi:Retrovirus-related Pol polyprotein from transposon 17.6 [Senna tora]|uniref:Retrovirus-related Pol polyprotein from transposon 17.6 n=1 Tax=Senna tora TaxID=362788 RepID=A0A834TGF6_9FABA|nr:Retrovirus-related Pol polyprotein from transposon 17.6 [Senna tora]
MRDTEITVENSQKTQETHKTSQDQRNKSQKTERSKRKSRRTEAKTKSQRTERSKSSKRQNQWKKKKYSFTDEIMEVAMRKLRTLTPLKHYDGTSDPLAHVNSFTAAMLYAGAPSEVMCRAFPSTLIGDAQLWFSDLPPGKVALSYLMDNLRSKLFCCSITKKPPKTMAELIARSTMYIAFEEVEQAKAGGQPKKDEVEPSRGRIDEDRREYRGRRDHRNKHPCTQGGTREQDYHRRKDRDQRRDDCRRQEGNTNNVAKTIHVIVGGVVRGTEMEPRTKKRQIRSVMKLEHESKRWLLQKNGSRVGITITTPEGKAVEQALQLNFRTTNNQAEYEALIAGLSDSQLVVGQLNGTFDVKEPTIARYVALTKQLMEQFLNVTLERIPRDQNEREDSPSKLASASARYGANPILKASLEIPSIDDSGEVSMILEENNWRISLVQYLARENYQKRRTPEEES